MDFSLRLMPHRGDLNYRRSGYTDVDQQALSWLQQKWTRSSFRGHFRGIPRAPSASNNPVRTSKNPSCDWANSCLLSSRSLVRIQQGASPQKPSRQKEWFPTSLRLIVPRIPLGEQWLVLRSGATHQRSGSDGLPGQPMDLHSCFSSLIGLERRARALVAACLEQASFSGESSAVVLSH